MIVGLILIGLLMCGATWAYRSEKKAWNNGICADTGDHWVSFDMDSQGGRGYTSEDYTVWISWPGIDRNYNHLERKILGDVH